MNLIILFVYHSVLCVLRGGFTIIYRNKVRKNCFEVSAFVFQSITKINSGSQNDNRTSSA